jgi:hypothetical protein
MENMKPLLIWVFLLAGLISGEKNQVVPFGPVIVGTVESPSGLYVDTVESPVGSSREGGIHQRDDQIDPFQMEVDSSESTDPHRWSDQVLIPGDDEGPDYITIRRMSGEREEQVTILFRVEVKKYRLSLRHPDRNRGVVLMSGRPASPDLYCFLRPFHVTESTADFIVLVSQKSLENVYLVFIPLEGNRRYLYELKNAVSEDTSKSSESSNVK